MQLFINYLASNYVTKNQKSFSKKTNLLIKLCLTRHFQQHQQQFASFIYRKPEHVTTCQEKSGHGISTLPESCLKIKNGDIMKQQIQPNCSF